MIEPSNSDIFQAPDSVQDYIKELQSALKSAEAVASMRLKIIKQACKMADEQEILEGIKHFLNAAVSHD